jgi:hypothetical protein
LAPSASPKAALCSPSHLLGGARLVPFADAAECNRGSEYLLEAD